MQKELYHSLTLSIPSVVMSRIGVVSDIHGNLPALEAVLTALGKEGVRRILCCGDLVGYGPWPGPVLARLREFGVLCIQGNHDAAVCKALPLDHFHHAAQFVVEWTRSVLSLEEMDYLKGLSQSHAEDRLVMVHGSLRGPLWEYILDRWVAGESFALLDRPLGLFGHSHIQGGFIQLKGRIVPIDPTEGEVSLLSGARYLINPGSVGQPRDGDPRAAYALLDLDQRKVLFKRISYDIESVMHQILEAGLPREFAERLVVGR